jgi:hypothetical protein
MQQAAERIGATIEAALAGRPKAKVVELGPLLSKNAENQGSERG